MINTKRQRSVFNEHAFTYPIMIVGAGGMGSRIAEGLVRMGLGSEKNPICIFDPDHFEEHNLANQLVFQEQIGQTKVAALQHTLQAIEPALELAASHEKIGGGNYLYGVVFLCLDNMDARAEIMEHCLENNQNVACVIETRMDAGVGISFCFDPNNRAHQECWWSHWYPSQETENIAGCGGEQSIISAIFGTSMLALKQLEEFARKGTTHGMCNRIYQDFDYQQLTADTWPIELDHFGFAT